MPLPLAPPCIRASWHSPALRTADRVAFALWPLGRAHDVPVSALFRDEVRATGAGRAGPMSRHRLVGSRARRARGDARLRPPDRGDLRRRRRPACSWCCAGRRAAHGWRARLPRRARRSLRLAIANIHRPGCAHADVVLSLGLGSRAAGHRDRDRRQSAPAVHGGAAGQGAVVLLRRHSSGRRRSASTPSCMHAPGAKLERVPMLRGRIVAGERRAARRT